MRCGSLLPSLPLFLPPSLRGLLTEIKELRVAGLPSAALDAKQPFDAWQMLRFGVDALSWMTQQVRTMMMGGE